MGRGAGAGFTDGGPVTRNKLRRLRQQRNRENYLNNRRNWRMDGGPLVVMDDPTEEHAKSLLLDWIRPTKVAAEAEEAVSLADLHTRRRDKILCDVLREVFKVPKEIRPDTEVWSRLLHMATAGPVPVSIPPFKVASA